MNPRCIAAVLSLAALALLSACKPERPAAARSAADAPAAANAPATASPETPAASGDASGPAVLIATGGGNILIEAEDAASVEKPMIKATDDDKETAGGKVTFLWCPEGEGCKDISSDEQGRPLGKAVVSFKVPRAGRYWFWARTWSHCSCGDSCYFSIRKGAVPILSRFKMTQPTHETWQWIRRPGAEDKAAITLGPGEYELVIENNEDGMRIDKILLATDPPGQFVPVGPNP
jgi:hypothetical protein